MRKKESLEDRVPTHITRCIEQKGIVYGIQQGFAWYCTAVERCPYKRPSDAYNVSYCGKRMR